MIINEEFKVIWLTGTLSSERHAEVDQVCNFLYSQPMSTNKLTFIINSNGGETALAIQLINAIHGCKACYPIFMRVNGKAFSCAADIALSGTHLEILPGSLMVFHGSIIIFENNAEMSARNCKDYIEVVENASFYLNRLAHPFLSEQEIEFINNRGELYLPWNDPTIEERIKRHFG